MKARVHCCVCFYYSRVLSVPKMKLFLCPLKFTQILVSCLAIAGFNHGAVTSNMCSTKKQFEFVWVTGVEFDVQSCVEQNQFHRPDMGFQFEKCSEVIVRLLQARVFNCWIALQELKKWQKKIGMDIGTKSKLRTPVAPQTRIGLYWFQIRDCDGLHRNPYLMFWDDKVNNTKITVWSKVQECFFI